jgi:hypothetical protein
MYSFSFDKPLRYWYVFYAKPSTTPRSPKRREGLEEDIIIESETISLRREEDIK